MDKMFIATLILIAIEVVGLYLAYVTYKKK
jgi:hypothetical protein